MSIRPFSNGTQYIDWQIRNCDRCKKACTDSGNSPICPIKKALALASWGDGTISDELGKRMGYEPGNPRYTWDCPEKDCLKICLASSWKNEELVLQYAKWLREQGFKVDAFCDASSRRFVFSARELDECEHINHISSLSLPDFKRAFEEDKKWLDWSDVCVLLLPCGRSAHLEAGYAKGQGKGLIILSELNPGEWDVMYGFADYVLNIKDPKHLLGALYRLESKTNSPAVGVEA